MARPPEAVQAIHSRRAVEAGAASGDGSADPARINSRACGSRLDSAAGRSTQAAAVSYPGYLLLDRPDPSPLPRASDRAAGRSSRLARLPTVSLAQASQICS
jgi:hypothetical protein